MSTPEPTDPVHFDLPVQGVTSVSCASRLQQGLREVDGVVGASVNPATGVARVAVAPGQVGREQLVEAVGAAGFELPGREGRDDPVPQARAQWTDAQREHAGLLRDAALSAALTLVIYTLATFFASWRPGLWISLVLSAFVLVVPGRRFFEDAGEQARTGATNLNTLVAVGAGGAWLWSAAASLLPHRLTGPDLPLETAAAVVTLVLVGRWAQARAEVPAGAAFRALLALSPTDGAVLRGGTVVEVGAAQLRVGDLVVAQPGERIAADGVVEQGRSALEPGLLTGAAEPVPIGPGDPVMAGAVNGAGALRYRATATGGQTVFAGAVRRLAEAQASRPPIQRRIDPITRRFTAMVLALAAVTLGGWLLAGSPPNHAALSALAVVVVACPRALSQASAAAIQVGTGEASLRGISFRDAAALERLQGVRTLVTHKTGTITEGRFEVVAVSPAPGGLDTDTLRASLAAIEADSEHPLARALTADAPHLPRASAAAVVAVPGIGVTGSVDGRSWLVGSRRMLDGIAVPEAEVEAEEAEGRAVVLAAIDGDYAGFVALSDPIRAEATEVVAALAAWGVDVVLLTGDSERVAQAVATRVGLRQAAAEVLPEDKARHVDALRRARSGGVAMLGDATHEAAALAAADVGISLGLGAADAREALPIVLMSSDLRRVVQAIDLSRSTVRTIRQNLAWSVAYHLFALPVAAGVLSPAFDLRLPPTLAAAAMALAAVVPVANSLRLRRALLVEPR
jgi:Cu+-exporting ATPase